jgi:hypothetical protein
MTRLRTAISRDSVTPEVMLRKASLARTPVTRAKYAQRGLSHRGTLDRTTRTMLLRQLYLSHMEGRRFAEALSLAEQMLTSAVMPDVARQDAARACLGLGDRVGAIVHLRIASRVSPPSLPSLDARKRVVPRRTAPGGRRRFGPRRALGDDG